MTRQFLVIGVVWFAAAVLVSITGMVAMLRPPLPQVVLVLLTAMVLLAFWRSQAFRNWALALPLRALLLPHMARFAGFYFLALHARGELPRAFAVPGGWGDIITAAAAVALAFVPRSVPWQAKAYLAWNIFGFADILFVIITAARLALADPQTMSALLRLPLSLLPTFFVPIIVASHVIMFVRLRRMNRLRSK